MTLGADFPTILAAAQAGAAWAGERIWRDLAPLVTGYLRLQGARDPEDLTSETFIGVFSGIHKFSGSESAFRSWVLTIAHRRLLDDRRRRARRPDPEPLDARAEVHGGDVEEDALAHLDEGRLRQALATLSPDQRSVLTLRILGDLTIEQVAAVTGKRPGAVKALQRRGLAAVRKMYVTLGVPV